MFPEVPEVPLAEEKSCQAKSPPESDTKVYPAGDELIGKLYALLNLIDAPEFEIWAFGNDTLPDKNISLNLKDWLPTE